MGLLQKALETYDAHASLVGKVYAGQQPLAPVGHTIANASIEITLDEQGHFVKAEPVSKEDGKTIIPVTEKSAGRTSNINSAPHPLCERIDFLSAEDEKGEKRFSLYCKQLQAWTNSSFTHPMLQPILHYVQGRTLLKDLAAHNMTDPDRQALVRWCVNGIGEESGACWANQHLIEAFVKWYEYECEEANKGQGWCMILGEKAVLTPKHPRGLVPAHHEAKLISSNDRENFTFRGRFSEDWQAATVSYEASQKAHNALAWLIANRSVTIPKGNRVSENPQGETEKISDGGRVFLCWNPQGKKTPDPILPFITNRFSTTTLENYQEELRKTLYGRKTELPSGSGVVIASFDVATKNTARLALTYYNELEGSDFLQRLYDWDATCCWWDWNPKSKQYDVLQSPYLFQIIDCAFGTQRKEKKKKIGGKENYELKADELVMRQQLQRLIACRVDKTLFPADIERALVNRASTPQAYDAQVYRQLLVTACAVIRKYYIDHKKEELTMVLDPERKDRSYQFGRLLAVLEKAERDTYDKDEVREPNAIRLQSVYCKRPFHVTRIIESKLYTAYLPRLNPSTRCFFKNLIDKIMEQIATSPEHEWNKPLEDTYLIGYHLQRIELYKSRKQKEDAYEEEENEQ